MEDFKTCVPGIFHTISNEPNNPRSVWDLVGNVLLDSLHPLLLLINMEDSKEPTTIVIMCITFLITIQPPFSGTRQLHNFFFFPGFLQFFAGCFGIFSSLHLWDSLLVGIITRQYTQLLSDFCSHFVFYRLCGTDEFVFCHLVFSFTLCNGSRL